jgi:D-sedoheptulose 7-phosphate isomerase
MSIFETIINYYNGQMDAISNHTEMLTPYIAEAASLLSSTLLEDKKILCCSAGANYAIAEQFCNDLDGLESQRPALPCILLNKPQSLLSAMDQEQAHHVFSRQLNALAQAGDTLVVFSQTGQEKSLIQAVQTAHNKQLAIIFINSGKQTLVNQFDGNSVLIQLQPELTIRQSLALQFSTAGLLSDLTEQLLFGTLS